MTAYGRSAKTRPNRDRQRDDLIIEHIEVARRIALRVARRIPESMDKDDLIAAAMVGLAEAAERYDHTSGAPFVAFAERRIRGAVLDELRKGDIVPRRKRTRAKQVSEAIRSLTQEHARTPEDDEVAARLGVSLEEYQEELKMLSHVSLVASDVAGDRTADEMTTCPERHAGKAELVSRIRDALPRMERRDAILLSLYYTESFTYAEIAKILKVSESRVCQIHSRALLRLRALIEAPQLRVGTSDRGVAA